MINSEDVKTQIVAAIAAALTHLAESEPDWAKWVNSDFGDLQVYCDVALDHEDAWDDLDLDDVSNLIERIIGSAQNTEYVLKPVADG